jgi:hypothetical protein
MQSLLGPFQPDTNVSVALFFFDDTVVIINRRATHTDPGGATFGLLEFLDVRAHRVRNRAADVNGPLEAWAFELSASEYLLEVVQSDEQRTPDALSSHKHYVVADGNHRCIDIVAREVTLREIAGPLLPELQRGAVTFADDFQ